MPESLSVAARDHCLAPGRAEAPRSGGRYRALFEDLPPLTVDEPSLHALGRPGGPGDLGVEVADEADSAVAAVWPFFGQFLAHDITADRSPLVHHAARAQLRNARAPRVNLESVYGAGPEADVLHHGDQLGPVGGRIVGETLVGIIDADSESFRAVEPDWVPTLPARRAGAFGLADILAPIE